MRNEGCSCSLISRQCHTPLQLLVLEMGAAQKLDGLSVEYWRAMIDQHQVAKLRGLFDRIDLDKVNHCLCRKLWTGIIWVLWMSVCTVKGLPLYAVKGSLRMQGGSVTCAELSRTMKSDDQVHSFYVALSSSEFLCLVSPLHIIACYCCKLLFA